MEIQNLSRIARVYLNLAGTGYVLIGINFLSLGLGGGHHDSSPATLLLLVPGLYTTTTPFLIFAVCKAVVTSSWFGCAGNVTLLIGLLTLASVRLIGKAPGLIYILCSISAMSLINAILSAPTRGEIIGPLISVANAYAFILATREISRSNATEPSVV